MRRREGEYREVTSIGRNRKFMSGADMQGKEVQMDG
jgi:hypothetical protein